MTVAALRLLPDEEPEGHLSLDEFNALLGGIGEVRNHTQTRRRAYLDFVERWPNLDDWSAESLSVRLNHPAPDASSYERTLRGSYRYYVCALALLGRLDLDYAWMLGCTFGDLQNEAGAPLGMGPTWLDPLHAIAEEIGYDARNSRQSVQFVCTRIALRRGTTDWSTFTTEDLNEFNEALTGFCERDDLADLRMRFARGSADPNKWARNIRSFTHSVHTVLHHAHVIDEAPTVRRASVAMDRSVPPAVQTTFDRYLDRLRPTTPETTLANLRGSLLLLGEYLGNNTEVRDLTELDRDVIEDWLSWLTERKGPRSGRPMSADHRVQTISAVNVFLRRASEWEWKDVPVRPLLSTSDIPKRSQSVPRFLPREQLAKVHAAILELDNSYARAASLVARWVGARRSEIRRLELDCLDSYADGYPRLRIPAGKTYTERTVPLHPEAADALRECIELTRVHEWRPLTDVVTKAPTHYIFRTRRGLMSFYSLFDVPLQQACEAADLVDNEGLRIVSSHRFRHSVGTALAEEGAQVQTIMSILGHASASMSMVYARISDPTVRKEYEKAIANSPSVAGPALEQLFKTSLTDEAVQWLQTNYYKTALELGHCLRLPEEGPCECDLFLSCSKFLTTSEYAPKMRARIRTERTLVKDATERGWGREVERHESTIRRLEQLLTDLGEPLEGPEAEC